MRLEGLVKQDLENIFILMYLCSHFILLVFKLCHVEYAGGVSALVYPRPHDHTKMYHVIGLAKGRGVILGALPFSENMLQSFNEPSMDIIWLA